MGLQLIICVETNKKCNSDFIYIRSTINRFYDVDNANIRITPVYLDGKGKYASGKVKKEVASLKNQYKAAAKNNSSIVIYCFDCDNYDTKTEEHFRIIPYSTINGSSYLNAVKADAVHIDKKPISEPIYIATGNINNADYQAIINSEIIR